MSEKNNQLPDFTDNFKKIYQLTDNLRKLRAAFLFSKNDARAKFDQQFKNKWKQQLHLSKR